MTSPPLPSLQPADDCETLKLLLEQQLDIYRRLEELSLQQARCLEEGWPQQLLAVLDLRQRLIDELTELCQRTQAFRQAWPGCLAGLPPTERTRLENLARSVQEMHQRVLERDRQNLESLRRLHEETCRELTEAHRAGQAMQGYHQPEPPAPGQMDQEA